MKSDVTALEQNGGETGESQRSLAWHMPLISTVIYLIKSLR